MDYTQLFRSLRESKSLTLDQLARLARVHRNTVVNIESGRPVKFKTIAALMQKMGFSASSAEMKSIGLLWLESVSGIPFSRAEPEATAKKMIATYRSASRQAARQLEETIAAANLTAEQIQLLVFAAQHPEVVSIIESIRDLATGLASGDEAAAELKAAEDGNDDYDSE
jgi:transcriptional regulator with XRE-family HTH domain